MPEVWFHSTLNPEVTFSYNQCDILWYTVCQGFLPLFYLRFDLGDTWCRVMCCQSACSDKRNAGRHGPRASMTETLMLRNIVKFCAEQHWWEKGRRMSTGKMAWNWGGKICLSEVRQYGACSGHSGHRMVAFKHTCFSLGLSSPAANISYAFVVVVVVIATWKYKYCVFVMGKIEFSYWQQQEFLLGDCKAICSVDGVCRG